MKNPGHKFLLAYTLLCITIFLLVMDIKSRGSNGVLSKRRYSQNYMGQKFTPAVTNPNRVVNFPDLPEQFDWKLQPVHQEFTYSIGSDEYKTTARLYKYEAENLSDEESATLIEYFMQYADSAAANSGWEHEAYYKDQPVVPGLQLNMYTDILGFTSVRGDFGKFLVYRCMLQENGVIFEILESNEVKLNTATIPAGCR